MAMYNPKLILAYHLNFHLFLKANATNDKQYILSMDFMLFVDLANQALLARTIKIKLFNFMNNKTLAMVLIKHWRRCLVMASQH